MDEGIEDGVSRRPTFSAAPPGTPNRRTLGPAMSSASFGTAVASGLPPHNAWSKYLAELVGTYFVVVTVGCNVLSGSIGAAFSIGSMLMAMVYSLGPVSGAHFNPAVTLAVVLSGRGLLPLRHACFYVVAQMLGGILGAATYTLMLGGSFVFEPVGRHEWPAVLAVEALYTAALCYVVLNAATSQKQDGNQYFGLAIGFTVVAATLSSASISGCSLNPTLSLASMLAHSYYTGVSALRYLPLYFFAPFVGSVVAFGAFYIVRKADEYSPNPAWKRAEPYDDLDSLSAPRAQ